VLRCEGLGMGSWALRVQDVETSGRLLNPGDLINTFRGFSLLKVRLSPLHVQVFSTGVQCLQYTYVPAMLVCSAQEDKSVQQVLSQWLPTN
jgi:hypothetical protein